jgi:hypothetical protein
MNRLSIHCLEISSRNYFGEPICRDNRISEQKADSLNGEKALPNLFEYIVLGVKTRSFFPITNSFSMLMLSRWEAETQDSSRGGVLCAGQFDRDRLNGLEWTDSIPSATQSEPFNGARPFGGR